MAAVEQHEQELSMLEAADSAGDTEASPRASQPSPRKWKTAAALLIVGAVLFAGAGFATQSRSQVSHGNAKEAVGLAMKNLLKVAFHHHHKDSKSETSSKKADKDAVPACLAGMKNRDDFDKCLKLVLSQLKGKGGDEYEFALAENLFTGKPLSPKMIMRQAEELTKKNSLLSSKRLKHMQAQSVALMKSSKHMMAALNKHTSSNTNHLNKATAVLTSSMSRCISSGVKCNTKCSKGKMTDGLSCAKGCTDTHSKCLTKAHGAHSSALTHHR